MIAVLRFLFVIPIAFVIACSAAGFALLWPFMTTAGAAEGDPAFWIEAVIVLVAQVAQVGGAALVPWGIFMAATEIFGWRSLLLHMAAGVVAGYGVMRAAYAEALPALSVQTALVVAGLTFALVYWLLAGRGAGRWRGDGPKRAQTPVETTPDI